MKKYTTIILLSLLVLGCSSKKHTDDTTPPPPTNETLNLYLLSLMSHLVKQLTKQKPILLLV